MLMTFHFRTHIYRLAAILLSAVCTLSAEARGRSGWSGDNYHFAYLSGAAGYTMLDMHSPNAIPSGDWGGTVGLGYEFRNSGFWTSVGAQFSLHRSSLALAAYREDAEGFATNGDPVTFHYDVTQSDAHRWNAIDVPVLFGYYKYGFYLGAGAKVGYYLRPETHSVGTYELSALHHQTNLTFANMPNHGYTTYDYDAVTTARLTPQVALIGEIGYDLLSSVPTRSAICHVLKLGFYFEYGLNTVCAASRTESTIVPDAQNATQATVLPYTHIAAARHERIAPYLTGIRLTYALGGSRSAHRGMLHHGCMCYQ